MPLASPPAVGERSPPYGIDGGRSGMDTNSMRQTQRNPLTLTKWLWLERKGGHVRQAGCTQGRTDHATTGSQNGADYEHQHMPPGPSREQRREASQECDDIGGKEQRGNHLLAEVVLSLLLPAPFL
jgi:hypothetical protein